MPQPLPALPSGYPLVLALVTAGGEDREGARQVMRQAVARWLSGRLGRPAEELLPSLSPGRPPTLPAAAEGWHLSLSHAPGLSLAALARFPVGVDLQVSAPPPAASWHDEIPRLALDYLGPATARTLAELPEEERHRAFIRAWTALEAACKCLGLGLAEWSPDLDSVLADCQVRPLSLPSSHIGYAGSVAWRLR